MKIVETDNFGGDYPDEKFVNLPSLSYDAAKDICRVINLHCVGSRYWQVVPDNYTLKPGFEP